jgi:two-component system sensor histidine kinase KdpD
LALIVFLLVGLAMGWQTGQMHDREADARARERETALLNRISANLVSVSSTRAMADLLLTEICSATHACNAMLFVSDANEQFHRLDSSFRIEPDTAVMTIARWVYQQNKAIGLPVVAHLAELGVEGWPISIPQQQVVPGYTSPDLFLPLQTTTRVEGVLYIGAHANVQSFSLHEARLLVSIANLAAAFLERQRLEAAASKAEALQEADRLKSTLMSSVSHELKTPLASITATLSSLLAGDVAWDTEAVFTELRAMGQDVDRLKNSINGLLDLSRLEADAWQTQRDWYEVGEILGSVLNVLSPDDRARITLDVPEDVPSIFVDFQQWQRALQHLVENALAYSPTISPVLVGARNTPRDVRIWVEDAGPGIPPVERERIFEKFYRGTAAGTLPSGTGLGLAIAAEIVRYHGGRIWVEDVQPHGARFVNALPREQTEGERV